ncbi:response regulator transcription factor [Streptomyces sp. 549]|uniref:response regulator transcription factor n=1 Tax=Streptomyces sp. 549 TaxID=3049076 RepID=UPI0024C3FA18|nr:response regulator transcription factor [Streptomyces sp. 549]MDK1472273.1 response regulator transcription factor [Streptomyces sp. 549]
MIRVLVVDDEELVRDALRCILSSHHDLSVHVTPSDAALARVQEDTPDLVLLDIVMPPPDGLTLLTAIRALVSPPPVGMLTTFETSEHLEMALRAGASGFLLKDSDPVFLGHAVRVLAGGGFICTPSQSRTTIGRLMHGPDVQSSKAVGDARLPLLTKKEHEVLALVAAGDSNAAIAARLGIGLTTVKTHVTALRRKLLVTSRVALATAAQRAGLD